MSLPSPVVSNNMNTSFDSTKEDSFNIDNNLSMYIPYVTSNEEFIKKIIQDSGFGKVKRVDCVSRGAFEPTSMAFIHMEYWENSQLVENFQDRIKNTQKEARIVYDDPNYWIVLPNKNPISDEGNERILNMQDEINSLDSAYNELLNYCKNLRWYINLHEANIEYLCNEIKKLTNSQEEISDEKLDNIVLRKHKRVRSSPTDNTCGSTSKGWVSSIESKPNTVWSNRLRPRLNGAVMKPYMYSEC